ncbi:hypothetical protein GCM10009719_19600 [Nocardioides kribbensis]
MAVVLVLALGAGGAAAWRTGVLDDAAREVGDRLAALTGDPAPGPDDPSRVPPPDGLDLPDLDEPAPVAAEADPRALDRAAVRRALAAALVDPGLGRHGVAAVAGLGDGAAGSAPVGLVARGRTPAAVPASTTKLLTAVGALSVLDPATTFETRVVRRGSTLTLVGGGDPFLARTPAAAEGAAYPRRADVTTLARRTAAALRGTGAAPLRLTYDASLFTGPAVNPSWPADYVPDGVVAPISALWVDEGRPAGGVGRVADPAREAADVFAAALRQAGVAVQGRPRRAQAAVGADPVAEVSSAPLPEIVDQLLQVSDNEATEVLLRHVGLASGGEGSSAAGVAGVAEVLRDLGVPVPVRQLDGSGLSRENLIAPETLVGVLRAVGTSAEDSPLRAVLGGLPVAGFTGSLALRFDDVAPDAVGGVRAKTGTLTGVSSLAGVAVDRRGTPLVFALMADRIREVDTLDARAALDRAAAALAACTCS